MIHKENTRKAGEWQMMYQGNKRVEWRSVEEFEDNGGKVAAY